MLLAARRAARRGRLRVAGDRRPTPAELKRLFDFLEFRTLADRLAEALGAQGRDRAQPRRADELVAEVTVVETAAEAVATLNGLPVLDLAARWDGRTRPQHRGGRRRGHRRRRCPPAHGSPATLLADPRSRPRSLGTPHVRGHNVEPLMRSLLGCGRRSARPARSTRRSPPTSSIRPRPATRCPT